ncbi:uncharacterized protein F21D5.5 [Anopheles bellator]|uniref:uncharacterized protein F21D5.5 n=1 Tax=Anopheles bellator TaxID=139047 RepID=UPI00264A158B|nr:uncharacterized protein F21D5.5 [Anopheles bellator]
MAEKVVKECCLVPLSGAHPSIVIKSEQMMVGRSPQTLIQDPNCSRNQVCLRAYAEDAYVLVKTLGLNPSVLNGKSLQRNIGYEAYDGDVIELLPGAHKYKFVFKYEEPCKRPDLGEVEKKTQGVTSTGALENHKERKTAGSASKRPREEQSAKEAIGDGHDQASKKRTKEDKPSSEDAHRDSYGSLKPTTSGVWESLDKKQLHVYTSAGVVASTKIAAYDMDGTLIKTRSGNVFPKSIDDWQIAFPEVPGKLKSLNKSGFKLVILTNQAGIGKGKLRIEDFRQKIESLIRKLGVPMQVFISTGSGIYRKPRTGMWRTLCEQKNDGVPVDKGRSFYVGDAAGRPEVKKPFKRKKDHSCVDRLLALNLGVPFLTPELHFQNMPEAPWTTPEFDPKEVCEAGAGSALLWPPGAKLTSMAQEAIIMVGFPGSGKSHFARHQLVPHGYELINRDTLGSWQKCVASMVAALKQGKRVVIDNTNPDAESRKRYLEVAARANVPVRCFVMDVSYRHARHNNEFRELTDRSHSSMSDMVFHSYKSKFQEPSTQEGFKEVVKVKFIPKFSSTDDEELYRMFLLEK